MSIFRTSNLRWIKYVETTRISSSSKLLQQKFVETTSIFRPSKFHRKSTWKRRGNPSIFCFRRIDIISRSNWRRFHVLCPLENDLMTKFATDVQYPLKLVRKTYVSAMDVFLQNSWWRLNLWNVKRKSNTFVWQEKYLWKIDFCSKVHWN